MAYHVRVYTTDIEGRKFPVDRDTYPDYPSAEMAANDIYQALTGEWPTREMHHVVKIYDGNRLVDELIWDGEGDYDPRIGRPRVRRKAPAKKKTAKRKATAKRRYRTCRPIAYVQQLPGHGGRRTPSHSMYASRISTL